MAKESRIRMDFVGKDCVKVTKSSVVEAVKLLEQNPQVSFSGSTREVIDYVASNLYGKHDGNHIILGVVWNDKENQSKFMDTKLEFDLEYNKINFMPVSEGLPKKLAELICLTKLVKCEPVSEEFK